MDYRKSGHIRQHQSKLSLIYRVSDTIIIWYTLHFSAHLYGITLDSKYGQAALAAMIIFYLVGESMRLYRSWRGVPLKQIMQPLLFAWVVTAALLLVLGYVTKSTGTYSRVTLGLWFTLTPLALIGWRICSSRKHSA